MINSPWAALLLALALAATAGAQAFPRLVRTVAAGGGYLYVEFQMGGVVEVAPNGDRTLVRIHGRRVNAQAVAVDHRGDLYLVGWIAGTTGEALAEVTRGGATRLWPLPPQVKQPEVLAVDSRTGAIYLAGISQLWKWLPGGALTPLGIGWNRPNSLTVDPAGNLYVADNGIFMITPDGAQTEVSSKFYLRPPRYEQHQLATDNSGRKYLCCPLMEIGPGNGTLLAPELFESSPMHAAALQLASGLAADDRGNLYLSTPDRVIEIKAGGEPATLLAGSLRPIAVASSPDGGAVVTVKPPAYGSPGRLPPPEVARLMAVSAGGASSSVDTGSLQPGAVARDAAGNVYFVAQNDGRVGTVYRRSPSGALSKIPVYGNGQIFGIAADSRGSVFLADSNHHRVLRVSADGNQTIVGHGLTTPVGLALDAAGDLYVADTAANRVVKIAPGGAQSTVPARDLAQPLGVAVDGTGNVYIADSLHQRAVEVTPAGEQRRLPTGNLDVQGIAVNASGDIYLAAGNQGLIRLTPGGGAINLQFTGLAAQSSSLEPETVQPVSIPVAVTPRLGAAPRLDHDQALYLIVGGCELDRWGSMTGGAETGLYFAAADGSLAGVRGLGGCDLDNVLDDQQGRLYVVGSAGDIRVVHENAPLAPDFYKGDLAETTGLNQPPLNLAYITNEDTRFAATPAGQPPVLLLLSSPHTIERFLGDDPAEGPRLQPGTPEDFQALRFSGALAGTSIITSDDYGKGISGTPVLWGDALPGGVGVPPLGVPLLGRPIVGPLPPSLPAGFAVGSASVVGSGVEILASSQRYFIITLGKGATSASWCYDRESKAWRRLPFSGPGSPTRVSLWGDWIEWPTPDGLRFWNLADHRGLMLPGNASEMQALDFSGNSLVYRDADRIYLTTLSGARLRAPQLLVHDPLAAFVHWAFWSRDLPR